MRNRPCSRCRAQKIRCEQLVGGCKNCLKADLRCSGPVKTPFQKRKEEWKRKNSRSFTSGQTPPSAADRQLCGSGSWPVPPIPPLVNYQESLATPPLFNEPVLTGLSPSSHRLFPVSSQELAVGGFPNVPACCLRCGMACYLCSSPVLSGSSIP